MKTMLLYYEPLYLISVDPLLIKTLLLIIVFLLIWLVASFYKNEMVKGVINWVQNSLAKWIANILTFGIEAMYWIVIITVFAFLVIDVVIAGWFGQEHLHVPWEVVVHFAIFAISALGRPIYEIYLRMALTSVKSEDLVAKDALMNPDLVTNPFYLTLLWSLIPGIALSVIIWRSTKIDDEWKKGTRRGVYFLTSIFTTLGFFVSLNKTRKPLSSDAFTDWIGNLRLSGVKLDVTTVDTGNSSTVTLISIIAVLTFLVLIGVFGKRIKSRFGSKSNEEAQEEKVEYDAIPQLPSESGFGFDTNPARYVEVILNIARQVLLKENPNPKETMVMIKIMASIAKRIERKAKVTHDDTGDMLEMHIMDLRETAEQMFKEFNANSGNFDEIFQAGASEVIAEKENEEKGPSMFSQMGLTKKRKIIAGSIIGAILLLIFFFTRGGSSPEPIVVGVETEQTVVKISNKQIKAYTKVINSTYEMTKTDTSSVLAAVPFANYLDAEMADLGNNAPQWINATHREFIRASLTYLEAFHCRGTETDELAAFERSRTVYLQAKAAATTQFGESVVKAIEEAFIKSKLKFCNEN